jgi:protease YdgD
LNLFTLIRHLILLIGLVVLAPSIWAQQKHVKSENLVGGVIVDAKAYPWSAIAKLNNGTGKSCSAVLISQDYALTAAHCLFFNTTGRFLPAQSLHLILGYENARFQSHLLVSAYFISSAYEPTKPFETLAHDWALLLISPQQKLKIQALGLSQLMHTAEWRLMSAGYSRGTPYSMTADRHCHFVGRSADSGLLYDSCAAPEGYSGGPLLIVSADGRTVSIAGIHVANQPWPDEMVAVAVPIETIWKNIKPCVQDNRCDYQVVAAGKDPTAAEILSGLPNLGYGRRLELSGSSLPCSIMETNC